MTLIDPLAPGVLEAVPTLPGGVVWLLRATKRPAYVTAALRTGGLAAHVARVLDPAHLSTRAADLKPHLRRTTVRDQAAVERCELRQAAAEYFDVEPGAACVAAIRQHLLLRIWPAPYRSLIDIAAWEADQIVCHEPVLNDYFRRRRPRRAG